MFNEYAKISSGSVFTTVDTFDSTKMNNNAQNPLGAIYYIPPATESGSALLTATGVASGLFVKYVRYSSTANPATVAGPAPVYWTDETFTVVTGVFSEGLVAATGSANSAAGWLLPNTTAAGSGF